MEESIKLFSFISSLKGIFCVLSPVSGYIALCTPSIIEPDNAIEGESRGIIINYPVTDCGREIRGFQFKLDSTWPAPESGFGHTFRFNVFGLNVLDMSFEIVLTIHDSKARLEIIDTTIAKGIGGLRDRRLPPPAPLTLTNLIDGRKIAPNYENALRESIQEITLGLTLAQAIAHIEEAINKINLQLKEAQRNKLCAEVFFVLQLRRHLLLRPFKVKEQLASFPSLASSMTPLQQTIPTKLERSTTASLQSNKIQGKRIVETNSHSSNRHHGFFFILSP